MKTRTALILGLVVLAVGIVLLLCYNAISSYSITLWGGIMLIVAGLASMVIAICNKDKNGVRKARGTVFWLTEVVSAAALALGLCVVFSTNSFLPVIPFVFGSLVAFGAIVLFYGLIAGTRPVTLPGFLYIFPTLVAVGAVLIFMQRGGDDDARIMIFTGVSFVLYAVCSLLGSFFLARGHRELRKAAQESGTPEARDAEANNADAGSADARSAEARIKTLEDE